MDLANHLMSLIDDYLNFWNVIPDIPSNQGDFKEWAPVYNAKNEELTCLQDGEIEIFKLFCENYIQLIQNLKSNLKSDQYFIYNCT